MSKSLPVYELGQWITTADKIGHVVARAADGVPFEIADRYANDPHVISMGSRGNGYCVAWGELQEEQVDEAYVARFALSRLRWLRAETIAEKRYQPCENPVKAPNVPMTQTELEQAICAEDSQPVLPLDIEAATEATMRAAVALGNQAADWLRAKGLTL